jgi:putative two-component system response regulator
LFLAKRRGRNQVCTVAQDLLPTLTEKGEIQIDLSDRGVQHRVLDYAGGFDLSFVSKNGLIGVLTEISRRIDERDHYQDDRSTRASAYASKLAKALNFTKEHSHIIELAAALNNLGKLEVPELILQKPGPLTKEEMAVMHRSPKSAAKLLEPTRLLQKVVPIVEAYREHWDGTGYPRGLKGDLIPQDARVVSLVDAYVAMTSDRPYRKGLTKEQAIREIQKGAGKKWDPRIVKIFLSLLRKESPGT